MFRTLLTALLLIVATAIPLGAQSRGPEYAVGLAAPKGALGRNRSVGPLLRAGLLIVDAGQVWRLRLDGEIMRMPGRPAPRRSAAATGDITSLGAMSSLVIGPSRFRVAPYVLVGAGLHVVRISGAPPTNYIGGLRAGLGVRTNAGRYRLSLEVGGHYNLSDRGTGEDYQLGSYVPITLGVAF